jgi:hypothetical protein
MSSCGVQEEVIYFICQNILGKGEWKDRTKEVMEKRI